MLNIMKADIYRMIKYKTIFAYLILIFMVYSMGEFAFAFIHNSSGIPISLLKMGFNGRLYFPFILIVYTLYTEDFKYKTLKNTISCVTNRKPYFLSKFILSIIIAALSIILCDYLAYNDYYQDTIKYGTELTHPVSEIIIIICLHIPIMTLAASFLTLLAIALRRDYLFIPTAILLPILPFPIIAVLYNAFDTIVKSPYSPEAFSVSAFCTLLTAAGAAAGYYLFKSIDFK
ncbi:MAG: hypothetical protein IJ861_04000 [Clostridia bacterium]|nr:hypothetical protein [Clostridia bacterium]